MQGYVHPDFAEAATILAGQIPKSSPGGAALTVFHWGEKVIDIWGGSRDEAGAPWEADTLALSFSTTKGVAATVLHVLASQGLVDYDKPVAHYWPAFAGNGKARITVRQALTHEAGLYNIHDMIEDASHMNDWNYMMRAMENASPEHTPGKTNGYHALTFGWLIGGLVEQVTGRPFNDVLQETLTVPLKLDGCYVGLPAEEFHRRALLIKPARKNPEGPAKTRPISATEKGISFLLKMSGFPEESIRQGLMPKGVSRYDFNAPEVVSACLPAANGMFTARSLATIYAMLAAGGSWQGKRLIAPDLIQEISRVHNTSRGRVIPVPMRWRLGYHRVFTTGPRTPKAFGHFGFGGSGAWTDPSRKLAAAMTVNSGVGSPFGDLRIWQLNSAIIRAAEQRSDNPK